jgi:hypothetical protein
MPVEQEGQNSTARPLPLSWSLVLAGRMGARIWTVILFILGAGLVSFSIFDRSLMWGAVAVFISFLCFGNLFFRHSYELNEEGLRIRTWYMDRRRNWSEFREVVRFTYGVELLTRAGGGRFDFMRSVSLFLPADDKEIIEVIVSKIRESKERGQAEHDN